MLNKDEIKELGIIINGEDLGSYRAASYDLRIGRVIAIQSENSKLIEQNEFFLLPAQGMAEVVSLETVRVPDDVAGYASVMTRSARQGLLPLNTGIVDPGYEGRLSATVVNFGRTELNLKRGAPFLRLTFHRYSTPKEFQRPDPILEEDFMRDRRSEVAENFSTLFLNLTNQMAEAFRAALRRNLGFVALLVSGGALVVTLTALGITLGVSYWQPYSMSKDKIRGELGSYFRDRQFDSLEERLANIEKREQEFETKTSAISPQKPHSDVPIPAGREMRQK
jgi:deoxycytidine triphosphate deaminase